MKLPNFLVADGTPLSLTTLGTAALTLASDEDWLECLEAARRNISNGGAMVPAGETWEQALANVAARLLRGGIAGTLHSAMGRTPDPIAWSEQAERWAVMVFDVAARGSSHHALVGNPPTATPTGTVFTLAGRVPLADVPRSAR
jgi:hypothetical protein